MSARTQVGGRRELQRLATERHILTAALELFVAHGYDTTTTKQIADAAGVAHGTVFLVAPTKEALLVKALEEQLRQEVTGRAASLPRRGIEAQLMHVFGGLFDFYARAPQLSRGFLRAIMFFAEPIAKAQYEEHVSRFSDYLATVFDAAKTRREISAHANSRVAAASVLAIYVYEIVAFLNADPRDRRILGARFRASLQLVIRGLGAAQPRRRRAPRGSRPPRSER